MACGSDSASFTITKTKATRRSAACTAKLGSKRHLICDGRGVPLASQLTGANRNDSQQAIALVDAIPRLQGERGQPRYLAKTLQVPILYELAESENWHPTISTLSFVAAAVPLVKYAGKKLIDVLVDLLRAWLQTHPRFPADCNGTLKLLKKIAYSVARSFPTTPICTHFRSGSPRSSH